MKYKIASILIFICQNFFAQNSFDEFFQPSDTLNKSRQTTVIIAQTALATTALVSLNRLWYADYPKSKFHFINDNSNWLQMDKIGHFYAAYHLGRLSSEALNWSGINVKNQLIYSSSLSLAFLTTIEVMDGHSAEWGASSGDLIANVSGTGLYLSQQLIWNEQRIIPKFSFHQSNYANYRPEVLGKTLSEQLIKDYNGQTYWFSINLNSFFKSSKIPKWLNLAIGYGAEGMLAADERNYVHLSNIRAQKMRQYYLSMDLDLTKIPTKSYFLKTFFSVFNTLKIPAPTIEYSTHRGFRVYPFYF